MNLGIGSKIKNLRTERGLTLKELGERVGLSVAYLSQLERGITSLTVETLSLLAEAMDADLHYFIGTPKGTGRPVVHKYERQVDILEENAYVHYSLSNIENISAFLPRYIEILPGENEKPILSYPHEGEEFLMILHGTLSLYLNNIEHQLRKGDCAHYNSLLPHKWVNKTNQTTQLICINGKNFYTEHPTASE